MEALQPGHNLQDALDAAAPDAVLRLAPGEYRLEGPLRIRRGIRLIGAGAAQTRLVRPRTPHAHIAEAHVPEGETLDLEDLAIAWSDDGDHLFQSDVLVVSGGRVTLRNCRLAGSAHEQANSNDMYGGSGLRVTGTSEVQADGCEFLDHGGHGVLVGERASLTLESCWVTANRGIGLLAVEDARIQARATAFIGNGRGGVVALDSVALTLLEPLAQANRRYGVRLETTRAVRLEGGVIEENAGPGLKLVKGTLAIGGVAIRRNSGDGLAIATGCRVTAIDLVIEGNRGFGLSEARATVELTRTTIFGNDRGGIDRG